jgi:hypothetical protein
MRPFQISAFGLLTLCISLTPSLADTGFVRAVISKSALIVGVGQGTGTLAFRGRTYSLEISGISFGATIGSSETTLTGHAFNIMHPQTSRGSMVPSVWVVR